MIDGVIIHRGFEVIVTVIIVVYDKSGANQEWDYSTPDSTFLRKYYLQREERRTAPRHSPKGNGASPRNLGVAISTHLRDVFSSR